MRSRDAGGLSRLSGGSGTPGRYLLRIHFGGDCSGCDRPGYNCSPCNCFDHNRPGCDRLGCDRPGRNNSHYDRSDCNHFGRVRSGTEEEAKRLGHHHHTPPTIRVLALVTLAYLAPRTPHVFGVCR